jgi:predicted oxidoreductase
MDVSLESVPRKCLLYGLSPGYITMAVQKLSSSLRRRASEVSWACRRSWAVERLSRSCESVAIVRDSVVIGCKRVTVSVIQ